MSLRITRQYADVCGAGEGKLRITRQYVAVLGYAYLHVATDALGIVDSAEATVIPGGGGTEATGSDTLSFDQVCQGAVDRTTVVEQSLGISDSGTGDPSHDATDSLALSDVAVATKDCYRTVTTSLELAQASNGRGPVYVDIRHVLNLSEPGEGHLGVANVAAQNVLSLSVQIGRTAFASTSNELLLAVECVRRKTGIVHDTLAFVGTATAGKSKLATSALGLSDTVVLQAILTRVVDDNLGLVHSGTYQVVGPSGLTQQYHPFVGFSTNGEISPPAVTMPTLSDTTVTLTYPFVTPTHTVVLRNPEFGNKDRLTFNRVNRQTRGGVLVIYADSHWPKTQVLQIEVRGLKASKIADLLAFFSESLGKEIGLLDHENRQWRGIITDPDTAIATPNRGDGTVTFEFEGELC